MQLTEVTNATTAKEFIQTNVIICGKLPNYIRPLDKDVTEVFDKEKNKAFRFGDATRWILKDNDGQLIGRIAAFTNKKYRNKIIKILQETKERELGTLNGAKLAAKEISHFYGELTEEVG